MVSRNGHRSREFQPVVLDSPKLAGIKFSGGAAGRAPPDHARSVSKLFIHGAEKSLQLLRQRLADDLSYRIALPAQLLLDVGD